MNLAAAEMSSLRSRISWYFPTIPVHLTTSVEFLTIVWGFEEDDMSGQSVLFLHSQAKIVKWVVLLSCVYDVPTLKNSTGTIHAEDD